METTLRVCCTHEISAAHTPSVLAVESWNFLWRALFDRTFDFQCNLIQLSSIYCTFYGKYKYLYLPWFFTFLHKCSNCPVTRNSLFMNLNKLAHTEAFLNTDKPAKHSSDVLCLPCLPQKLKHLDLSSNLQDNAI